MVKIKKINHTEEIKKQIYKYILMQILFERKSNCDRQDKLES